MLGDGWDANEAIHPLARTDTMGVGHVGTSLPLWGDTGGWWMGGGSDRWFPAAGRLRVQMGGIGGGRRVCGCVLFSLCRPAQGRELVCVWGVGGRSESEVF